MRKRQRLLTFLLTLCLLASLALPAWAAPEGAESVTIATVEDFLTFAHNCSLDTWSQGKTFSLTADLDLTGRAFDSVPTFGGTFLGNGHTISGLSLTGDGSGMGLFRAVQAGAVIQGLRVSGRVAPGGSAVCVGGVAGHNAGAIRDCSFSGVVAGKTAVGGIVGENQTAGEVSGCSAQGSVTGETATGGVAGRNYGVLLSCQNAADVNTSDPDPAGGGVTGSALDQLASPDAGEEAETLLNSNSDTGGVAGYTSGVIQSCANLGTVGYNHVGYNVGGVAGRQAGYISGCSNSGTVLGRKDVGGIVGQAEPDIFLRTDEDALAQLRRELDTLNRLVDQALDHADAGRADISQKLTSIGDAAGMARDSAKTLLDHGADFIDENLETLNTLDAAVTAALDGLSPALDSLSDASGHLETMGDQLDAALDTLSASDGETDELLDQGKAAAEGLRQAADDLKTTTQDLREAADALREAVLIHDQAAIRRADRDLAASVQKLGTALRDAHASITALKEALGSRPGLVPELRAIADALGELGTDIGSAGAALESMGQDLGALADNIDIDWDQVRAGLDAAQAGLDSLGEAAGHMGETSQSLEGAMDAAGPLTDRLEDAAQQFSDAAAAGSGAAESLRSAFAALGETADQLARDADVQLTPLGQTVRDAGDGLYASLSSLSDDLSALQTSVDSAGDDLSADLRAISRQMTKIFDLMLDTLDSAQTVTAPEDLFGDVSETDIDATRLGKTAACVNTGAVEGDRNVGGVAGAVAVEYSLDPEDDAARFTFGKTYELKAILQDCVNRGAITGRRDCVGGVAGRMDLGTATGCENYGAAVSTGGGYVGGIAGYTDAALRDSWAKCALSGESYVGGVAGWAGQMTGCRAIATIQDGTEYVGAIAGGADLEGGGVRDNRFVDTGWAAIDGVSYAGLAEPVPFSDLEAEAGAPAEFLSFALTLTAEGETVAVLPFRYGDDLSRLDLPAVPEKEGCYGTWPAFDRSGTASDITLDAVYTPWVTLVASDQTEGDRALALAEGRFTGEAVLSVSAGQEAPPDGAEGAEVWEVALSGADLAQDASVPLRLLNRVGKRAAVWQLTDGQWRKVDAAANGSYLCLTMAGTSGVFCVCPALSLPLVPILLAAAAALLLLLIVLLLRRRAKRKRKPPVPTA